LNYLWCFTVQIICKDGTTIQCRDFRATDSGVLFFQETPGRREESEGEDEEEQEEEREMDQESASGFVPITELHFVLPDEMVQRRAEAQRAGYPQQSRMGGAPPDAPQQRGQVAQQQQMQQRPGTAPQGPYGSGGQER